MKSSGMLTLLVLSNTRDWFWRLRDFLSLD